MHPVLFRIPMPGWDLPLIGTIDSIPIYSYGVMLGLSLVVGWYLTLGLAQRDGLPRETMANNYVITALSAIVAARLLYVVTNLDEFETFTDVFSMRRGGLVVYGGFLGGLVASWSYLKAKRTRLLPWADVAVPSLASGLAITRIGCYLFGCDYGKPLSANAPGWLKSLGRFPHWAEGTLPYGSGAPAWVHHIKPTTEGGYALDPSSAFSLEVHPTQLYESAAGLSLLALLLLLRRRQRFRGQVFFMATFGYGAIRFLLEILRDDLERGNLPGSVAVHILLPACLALFAIGYTFSFARLIERIPVRRVSQVVAFAPALIAAITLRPEQYAAGDLVQLSTSQFIGMASSLAVCLAYVLYDNAALAHPETAMDLGLPEGDDTQEQDDDGAAKRRKRKAKAQPDDSDGDGEPRAKKKRRKKKRKSKPKKAEEAEEAESKATDEADAGDRNGDADADATDDEDA